MEQYDSDKEYLINVITQSGEVLPDIVLCGRDIEVGVKEIFSSYSEIRKVVVYDNETKEAVHIYR